MINLKIGDYVEVDIGLGLCAIGKILTEDQYMYELDIQTDRWDRDLGSTYERATGRKPTDRRTGTAYRIKFVDGSTHTARESECCKIEAKDEFILKLKDGQDKDFAKIYEAMDCGK